MNLKKDELDEEFAKIQDMAGYHFKDLDLMREAFIHPSYVAEMSEPCHQNQRLEFLGDAVLQIILSVYLYKQKPDAQEGELTRMRAYMANEDANASYTRKLGLHRALLLGKGENLTGGRERPSIMGDLFEAFLGAIYLDGGYDAAEKFCLDLFPDLDYVKDKLVLDENPKGALQELVQEHKLGKISYELINRSGPTHAPVFEMRTIIGMREAGRGSGTSQKSAERMAALNSYRNIEAALKQDKPIGEICVNPIIIALDFDGVLCDSAAETAASGWRAAQSIWPNAFKGEVSREMVQAFRQVRPFLETGFQAIPLLKLLRDGKSPEDIGDNAEQLIQETINASGYTQKQMIDIFGETRDNWIRNDMNGWLAWHSLYEGIPEALKTLLQKQCHLLILTTKQERFVAAILKHYDIDFPTENIWGLERKRRKEDILLEQLMQHPKEMHFVEDRLKTLIRMEYIEELESVKLHYADWGYGTAQDLKAANLDPHIRVQHLKDFTNWLSNDFGNCSNLRGSCGSPSSQLPHEVH